MDGLPSIVRLDRDMGRNKGVGRDEGIIQSFDQLPNQILYTVGQPVVREGVLKIVDDGPHFAFQAFVMKFLSGCEVMDEELPELGRHGVVTVTIDDFALKMLSIMGQLIFNVLTL